MTQYKKIGRYIVQSTLGEGAMGSVFKALDPFIKRTVAIKIIKLDQSRSEKDTKEFYNRFLQEAQISGQLHHPNIVSIFDVGEQEGMPYIAIEYVKGLTLNEFVRKDPKPKLGELFRIVMQLAAALDYAHSKGVIHRDLKPSNIMVMPDGVAKIMDFGIAKMSGSHLTQTGIFLGTPSYSSPEQIKEGQVDYRSDIFSFGILAHETLTGFLPFPGQSINAILYKIANEPPVFSPNLKKLPVQMVDWRKVFLKVLHKNPDLRYQTAQGFSEALLKSLRLSHDEMLRIATAAHTTTSIDSFDGIQKSLQRSEFEMAQTSSHTLVIPRKPGGHRTLGVLLTLLLLTIAGSGYLLWRAGRLEPLMAKVTAYFNDDGEEVVKPSDPAVSLTKKLRFTSAPAGAVLWIEGAEIGPVPLEYPWTGNEGARLRVELRLDGYEHAQRELLLSSGLEPHIKMTLEAKPVSRVLTSDPAGALVQVDDRELGETPLEISFTPGRSYNIRVNKSGFVARDFQYTEGKSKTAALDVQLKPIPPPGKLAVDSLIEDLTVHVNGSKANGTTISLAAGSYKIRLASDRYFYEETVRAEISSGETLTLKTPVIINIPRVEYIGSAGFVMVKIDGRFVKNGDEVDTTPLIDLKIAAGTHLFEFVGQDDKIVAQKTVEVKRSEGIIITADQ